MEDLVMAQLPVVAPLDMQDQKITDLQRPTNPADAATMEYADNATTGVEIAPLSVRVGGVSGSHVLRTASTNTRAGDLVSQRDSALTDSSFETLAGGNRLVIHDPHITRDGAFLTQGDEFVMTVADSALTANLPNGTYLVSFVGYVNTVGGDTHTAFDDVRPLDAQGTAGTALTFANSNGFSAIGSDISFFEAVETLASFEFHNTDTDENVFTVNYTTEVVDFSQNPTVNGVVIGGGTTFAARLFTVAGVYATGDMVVQETEPDSDSYQAWILTGANLDGSTTPISAANSPGGSANQWEPVPTIEELNNIVARLENEIENIAPNTPNTCLLYTSPSPRDS